MGLLLGLQGFLDISVLRRSAEDLLALLVDVLTLVNLPTRKSTIKKRGVEREENDSGSLIPSYSFRL